VVPRRAIAVLKLAVVVPQRPVVVLQLAGAVPRRAVVVLQRPVVVPQRDIVVLKRVVVASQRAVVGLQRAVVVPRRAVTVLQRGVVVLERSVVKGITVSSPASPLRSTAASCSGIRCLPWTRPRAIRRVALPTEGRPRAGRELALTDRGRDLMLLSRLVRQGHRLARQRALSVHAVGGRFRALAGHHLEAIVQAQDLCRCLAGR